MTFKLKYQIDIYLQFAVSRNSINKHHRLNERDRPRKDSVLPCSWSFSIELKISVLMVKIGRIPAEEKRRRAYTSITLRDAMTEFAQVRALCAARRGFTPAKYSFAWET